MAEEQKSSTTGINKALEAERTSRGASDRSSLSDTLVKSPQWKKNTLQLIEALRAGEADDDPHAREIEVRDEEIERLRETVLKLKAEKAQLAESHREEIDTKTLELLDLQAAYEQFEQQSDMLLSELDQQNERLRAECKLQNRRSML